MTSSGQGWERRRRQEQRARQGKEGGPRSFLRCCLASFQPVREALPLICRYCNPQRVGGQHIFTLTQAETGWGPSVFLLRGCGTGLGVRQQGVESDGLGPTGTRREWQGEAGTPQARPQGGSWEGTPGFLCRPGHRFLNTTGLLVIDRHRGSLLVLLCKQGLHLLLSEIQQPSPKDLQT